MTTQLTMWVAGGGVGILLICFGFLILRLAAGQPGSRRSLRTPKPGNPLDFRPMQRLLSKQDFDFLAAQPGFNRKIAARLRRRRIGAYKQYLRQLSQEFHRLHLMLRLLTLSAEQDRPEVSRVLVEQRLLFAFHMTHARMRLAFFGLGMAPLDLTPMLRTVDQMRQSVRQLSLPIPAEAASLVAAR